MKLEQILNKAVTAEVLTDDELKYLLLLEEREDMKRLFETAYQIKMKYSGKKVYFRGIVELSNICKKNCYYCGIRAGNKNVQRFMMKEDEIVEGAIWAFKNN